MSSARGTLAAASRMTRLRALSERAGSLLEHRRRAHALAGDPKIRTLAGLPALRECTAEELSLIGQVAEIAERPPGTRLATQGKWLDGPWCMLSGIALAIDDDTAVLLTCPAISPVDSQLRATKTVQAVSGVRILEVATHDLRRWNVPALRALLLSAP